MQAIKDKLNDIGAMRKAKAEAKEEEKAEKELAKARVEVAHEVRLAREAEAAMDLHVQKAADKVTEHERKHLPTSHGSAAANAPGYSAHDPMYTGGPAAASGHDKANIDSTRPGFTAGPPTNNNLL